MVVRVFGGEVKLAQHGERFVASTLLGEPSWGLGGEGLAREEYKHWDELKDKLITWSQLKFTSPHEKSFDGRGGASSCWC